MSQDQIFIELVEDGQCPKRMSTDASAYDVFAREIEMLSPNSAKIKLGFKIDTRTIINGDKDVGMAAILMPRSGWGAKHSFRMLNTIGLIDMDYRGEVMMFCEWDTPPQDLLAGASVGQLMIAPVMIIPLTVIDTLSTTERGDGGFGSTSDGC